MKRRNNEVSNYIPEMSVTGKWDGQFLWHSAYDLQSWGNPDCWDLPSRL